MLYAIRSRFFVTVLVLAVLLAGCAPLAQNQAVTQPVETPAPHGHYGAHHSAATHCRPRPDRSGHI